MDHAGTVNSLSKVQLRAGMLAPEEKSLSHRSDSITTAITYPGAFGTMKLACSDRSTTSFAC